MFCSARSKHTGVFLISPNVPRSEHAPAVQVSGSSADPCAAGCAFQPAFHSAYVVHAVNVARIRSSDLPPAPVGDSLAVQAALHATETPGGALCPPQPPSISPAPIATDAAKRGTLAKNRGRPNPHLLSLSVRYSK
jgi:hypothetical protein